MEEDSKSTTRYEVSFEEAFYLMIQSRFILLWSALFFLCLQGSQAANKLSQWVYNKCVQPERWYLRWLTVKT